MLQKIIVGFSLNQTCISHIKSITKTLTVVNPSLLIFILVSYHKGVDNNIWINRDLPFPVKAQMFADITTGNPPIQYAFDFLATGQGAPPIPKSQIEIPKPPLKIQTTRGTYYIQLLWDPQTIQVGKDTDFGVIFQER